MATTRATIRAEVQNRLGDAGASIWPVAELNGYFDQAIKSLYPTYFITKVATTVAVDGPIQTKPAGARDLYFIGLQKVGSTRVRLIRQWREGFADAYIPKTGITGDTLVWAWTSEFTQVNDDVTALDAHSECEEVLVLRMCITALERIVSNRVKTARYFALTVREGVTESDLTATLDALHASLQQRLQQAVKRPDRIG